MGGCCQGVLWHREFCDRLANEGFYVIRYDHRDSGLSTCFDFAHHPYDLLDMMRDAAAVLEVAGVEKAHLFGVSLGGLLAELMAVYFPEKVNTMLLLGSTSEIRPMNLAYAGISPEENAMLPPPTHEYLSWMREFMQLSPQTNEEKLAQRMEGWNKLNGKIFPLNERINREIHQEFLARLRYPPGMINHILMLKDSQSEILIRNAPFKIRVPTVILQGSEDPIFPPDHGKALSQKIKDSEYLLIEGMGHVPSDHFYDLYVSILTRQSASTK